MNATQTMWIVIIIIVAVLVILGLVFYFGRRTQLAHRRIQATELRHTAKNDELNAREVEAKAAQADADAKQSEVDAARSRQEADERQGEAQAVRARSDDQSRQADELDPDVNGRHRRRAEADNTHAAAAPRPTDDPPTDDRPTVDEASPLDDEAGRFTES